MIDARNELSGVTVSPHRGDERVLGWIALTCEVFPNVPSREDQEHHQRADPEEAIAAVAGRIEEHRKEDTLVTGILSDQHREELLAYDLIEWLELPLEWTLPPSRVDPHEERPPVHRHREVVGRDPLAANGMCDLIDFLVHLLEAGVELLCGRDPV